MWFLRVQGEDYRRGKEEGSHTPVDPKGSADDGKRSEAEWTLYNGGIKREGGSGGRGYRDHPGRDRILGRRICKKAFQKWNPILHDSGAILGA